MSSGVRELIAASFDAYNRTDWEAMEPLYWPDAEARAPEGWPEAEAVKGWPAIRRQFERLKDSWAEDRFEFGSAEDLGEDRALIHGVWHTRGKESGIEADVDSWVIVHARDGKLSQLDFYLDEEQARAAASQG
jgi:ketosteroid isomerase-like protein